MLQDEVTEESKEVSNLASWKNTPTVAELKKIYDDAKIDHSSHMSKVNTWRDNLKVTGGAKVKPPTGNSAHVPKLIRKQAEWRYPGLSEPFLSTEDVFNVLPTSAKDTERARQNALVLNNQFNTKLDKVKLFDDLARAAVDEGTVVIRTAWETFEEMVTTDVPVYSLRPDPSRKHESRYMQLIQLKQEDPEQAKQFINEGVEMALQEFMLSQGTLISTPYISSYRKETVLKETRNQPVVEICDLDNIVFDPTCGGDLSKASFAILSFETSLSELRKEGGKYSNLDDVTTPSTNPSTDPDYSGSKDSSTFTFTDKARKKVLVREYTGLWDIHDDGTAVAIIAAWIGDVIIRMELTPYPDKQLPYVTIPYMPIRQSVYGEPDGELLVDNQKIMGALSRGIIDVLAKSANGQTGMRKDMLDITNKRKFARGENYEFNAIADPRQGIYSHVYPEIPASAYNLYNMQASEAESITGIKAFNNGISGDSYGTVAAGVKGTLDATSVREAAILRRLTSGMEKVARKVIAMNSVFLSDEEVVRITDEEFVVVRRDDLAGNFDIKVSISTAEEDNKRAEELSFLLQTLGNNVDPEITFMLLAEVARLRRAPRLAERIENYKPKPDPMKEQLQRLQMEELVSNIQKNYAEAQKLGMAAEYNRAQAVTEQTIAVLNQAKAKLLGSQSDLHDLDFIEQESGVHQERELQKLGAQAHAQAQTKVIDAALKQATAPRVAA